MATHSQSSKSSRRSPSPSRRADARTGGDGKSRSGGRRGGSAKATIDQTAIRRWAEERGGKPSCVRGTGGKGDPGLRIDFPGYSGADSLQEISWDEFFEKFDDRKLALLHQDKTAAGRRSNFNKLVKRGGGSGPSSSSKGRHGRSAR